MYQKKTRIDTEFAENLAVKALQYIAGDHELLQRFLAITGVAPEDLRALAGTAEFRAGLMEFITNDEPTLLAFAASVGEEPQVVANAGALLSGGNGDIGGL